MSLLPTRILAGITILVALAFVLVHTHQLVLADNVTRLSGGPGSVTVNGRPAPEGTLIEVLVRATPHRAIGDFTFVRSDGSWSIELNMTGSIEISVDCFRAEHEVLESTPESRDFHNVRLVAGVATDPTPFVLCFRGLPGSVKFGGLPAGRRASVEIRASNAAPQRTAYWSHDGWALKVSPSLADVTFWVDGRPTTLPSFTPDPADAPFLFTLNVELETPAPMPPPEHLWDIVVRPTRGTPIDELEPDSSLPTHIFSGTDLPDGVIRAIFPPDELQPDFGKVIATAKVMDGSWSISIPRTRARAVVFETGQSRSLRRTGKLRVIDHGTTTVPATAFALLRNQYQILYGRGFPSGGVYAVDANCESGTPVVQVEDGEWHIALDSDSARRYVVRFGYPPTFVYTDVLDLQFGQLTEVTSRDFKHPTCEAATNHIRRQELSSEMESGSDQNASANVYIVARRLANGRVEFGLRHEESLSPVFPRLRFLSSRAAVGRWARSSPVSVGTGLGGWIVARPKADGRIEFGLISFSDGQTRILPTRRTLSVKAEVGQWKRSSVITIEQ